MSQNLSSAAVVIGSLRVKLLQSIYVHVCLTIKYFICLSDLISVNYKLNISIWIEDLFSQTFFFHQNKLVF